MSRSPESRTDRLQPIEDVLPEVLGHCPGCNRAIREGEPTFSYEDEGPFCKGCAPTWQEMVEDESGEWFDRETGEPLTRERRQEWADRYIAAGGEITDSMAR